MPATFHGGPFHGVTVDAEAPTGLSGPLSASQGAYRLEGGGSLVWEPAQLADPAELVHVRPAEPAAVEVRPKARQVTRR